MTPDRYEMSIGLGVLDHLGLNLYSNVPAVGQYGFVETSGNTLVNGFAYSYAVLNARSLIQGDHFVFLPALNLRTTIPAARLNVTITYESQIHTQTVSGFYYKIYIPLYDQTLAIGGFGTSRDLGTSTATVGYDSSTIMFTQVRWLDDQTVKLYCYIGQPNTPPPL